jgi:hypothetical protein
MLWTAGIAYRLDTADPKNGANAFRVNCPPDRYRVPQMSGESLCREAIRYQIRDRIPGPIVDQQILAILLINAPG